MINEAFLYRLKAAQRDLILHCAGVERSAAISGFSKSQVGRWNNPLDGDLMPISAVIALEEFCRVPFVTAVMAEANGRRLTDPEETRKADIDLLSGHAEVMRQFGELALTVAKVAEDGKVTPTEAALVDRVASGAERALSGLRQASARIRANGGESSGLKIVKEQ